MSGGQRQTTPKWGRWEGTFNSERVYPNPLQEVRFEAGFESPTGKQHTSDGFWDGGTTWRVRFSPDEVGEWTFVTTCSDPGNSGLNGQAGSFECGEAENRSRFDRHGPIRVAENRRYLAHADGTPFFWLADTAWNGPLRSTPEEWEHYLDVRARQRFTAVQWVTTQWIAAPDGDLQGELAYEGREQIQVNPAFFQRLDAKMDAINRAGLLAVPVLLWAARWSRPDSVNSVNPGLSLPEDQAIALARYMVARWGAHQVAWILNGDGDYRGEHAARWQRIGRAVFGDRPHAPVSLHPGGRQWLHDEFADETWLDIVGYQSGHSVDEESLRWLVAGPPATDWTREPIRPFINLEPPYEDHMNMSSQGMKRLDAHDVRRALYSSLLVAPVAGVTYGGHGIWGWDDGTQPPVAHPNTGVPRPWQEALHLPAAEQLPALVELFTGIDWRRLRPAPELVLGQPGQATPSRTVVAAQADEGDLALIYTPEEGTLAVALARLRPELQAQWVNPTNGERSPASFTGSPDDATFATPAPGDWVLLLS
jgi:hypothetical protein